MSELTIALVLHVLAVVIWIGGVSMVTTVIIPIIRNRKMAEEQIALFSAIERRFVWQARGAVLIVGLTGFYMVDRLALWPTLASLQYWWVCAMVVVWLLFTSILFIFEPLFLHRCFEERATSAPEHTFALLQRMHSILLLLSAIAIIGGIAGSHGLTIF
jgi:uncharacterized membrane protein